MSTDAIVLAMISVCLHSMAGAITVDFGGIRRRAPRAGARRASAFALFVTCTLPAGGDAPDHLAGRVALVLCEDRPGPMLPACRASRWPWLPAPGARRW